MSLKKYSQLTEHEKKLVAVMYSDQSNLDHYLYNFDGEKYSGRQYAPPEGVIVAEGVESTKQEETPIDSTALEKIEIEYEPKPKRAKRSKKS